MNIADLLTFTRDQWWATTAQVTDTELLRYLNIAYHDLEWWIRAEVDAEFRWDIFTTNLVLGQNEYTLQTASATSQGITGIKRVEVLRDSDNTYYSTLKRWTLDDQTYATGQIEDIIPTDEGFFDVKDWSLFLFPTPENSVTNWLKAHALVTLIDLVSGWAETTIFPKHTELRGYHYAIGLWALEFILRQKNVKDKGDFLDAKANYENAKILIKKHLLAGTHHTYEWSLSDALISYYGG